MASMVNSANAAIATASNNAAIALASISGSLAAEASAARQSAAIEQANASAVRAQAQTQVMTSQGNAVSVTQTTIAIVASIAGTFILSLVGFIFFLRSRNRQQRRRIAELKGTIKRPISPTGSSNMVWDNKGWHQRSEKEPQREQTTRQPPEPQPTIGVATSSQTGREVKRSSNWPLSSSAQESNRPVMDPANVDIVKIGQAEGGSGANEPETISQQGTGSGSTKQPNLSLFPKITESGSKTSTPAQGKETTNTKQPNVNNQYPPRYSVEPEGGSKNINMM
ncbi:hypothetical protein J7T55_002305 [Diaporthe amygdali]|uniref:uncharacterized protein n=1 Tax=Phomopsis amygdali TaxID=1214568 RepID=UPI0022FE1367|nr:uncharacterized protein J7T55_002305 [Diaporthe amygdali]KAJ0109113.1 hypothetical protein J7T55_002305 [Diaporthe amygdali]